MSDYGQRIAACPDCGEPRWQYGKHCCNPNRIMQAAAPVGTPPTDALTIDELDECMKGYDIGDINQHVVLGRINKVLESRIAAALSAAQDRVREECVRLADSNGDAKPGEIIEVEGDVRSFVAGMNAAMQRISRAIRSTAPTSAGTPTTETGKCD